MQKEKYRIVNGKKLRCGYTTGSCAAAAASAATAILLGGRMIFQVGITLPNGDNLIFDIDNIDLGEHSCTCSVVKDAGDDPDVTDGIVIQAEVSISAESGIFIDGGDGVGRVTKPGLDQPVGNAAINSVPRKMIEQSIRSAISDQCPDFSGGLNVLISVPGGKKTAEKTFNPRLGIEGGISILGTTGIVEPMSEKALIDTINVELKQISLTHSDLILIPGNYGSAFIKNRGLNPLLRGTDDHVLPPMLQISNYLGESLDMMKACDINSALLVSHVGKLVKVAGGIMNTHSRYADCRNEIFTAHAVICGADKAICSQLMKAATTDACIEILDSAVSKDCRSVCAPADATDAISGYPPVNESGSALRKAVIDSILKQIQIHLDNRSGGNYLIGAVMFSNVNGLLGATDGACEIIEQWTDKS